jgi:hypothetical protein
MTHLSAEAECEARGTTPKAAQQTLRPTSCGLDAPAPGFLKKTPLRGTFVLIGGLCVALLLFSSLVLFLGRRTPHLS